jgi:hypothetical protein
MDAPSKREQIRTIVSRQDPETGDRILWSLHAARRLARLPYSRSEIESGLSAAELIEDYPLGHRALPDCLVLVFLRDQEPVHLVVAVDSERERLLIVTIYSPDHERWTDEWRKRR